MQRTGHAKGKIILSGEYAVVFGYPGIALPAKEGVEARFEKNAEKSRCMTVWDDQGVPAAGHEFLQAIVRTYEARIGIFPGTLTVECALPLGKGMGSSTALVIAVGRSLLGSDCREEAFHTENTMNPGHSGLDFTVIWNEKSVLFSKGKPPQLINISPSILEHMVLIDTGTPTETTPELVAWMHSREDEVRPFLEQIAQCTQRLVQGESIATVFPDHHRAQVALGVVPQHVQTFIASIENAGGAAKVLGAGARTGGGGMVLAQHHDVSVIETIASKNSFPILGIPKSS